MKNKMLKTMSAVAVAAIAVVSCGFYRPPPHGPQMHRHHHATVHAIPRPRCWMPPRPLPPPPFRPTVVLPPQSTTLRVWVPGKFIQEVDMYGRVTTRWIPGHWEYR